MAKGIGPGMQLLLLLLHTSATAEVISLLGATPIFVDIYESTFNMNPSLVEDAIKFSIKNHLNLKPLSPLIFGLPARYRVVDEISQFRPFCDRGCRSELWWYDKVKKVGSFGDVAATSFFG